MKLTDIMSNMGLEGWAELGLVIFLAVFITQAVWVFWPSRKSMLQQAGHMPLQDQVAVAQAPATGPNQHEVLR